MSLDGAAVSEIEPDGLGGLAAETKPDIDIGAQFPLGAATLGSELATRRRFGAYYTPSSAADYMADWVVRADGERILEPSFGRGVFLEGLARSAARRGFAATRTFGAEIADEAVEMALSEQLIAAANVRRGDFLGVAPFPVEAVIGNPPYVRLRQLPGDQRERALRIAATALGKGMDPSGSVWMPFVLHAMSFLRFGGRLAFVLPYESTYVRYARPLWQALGESFGSLRVLRTHERLFPDILQDVVILLADGYGGRTDSVRYQAFERVADLIGSRSVVDEQVDIRGLLRGERVFVRALLGNDLRDLLDSTVHEATVTASELVTFNIGYVAGDKAFFHPDPGTIADYEIPASSLQRTLTSTRLLKGAGLNTSSLDASRAGRLFLPIAPDLTAGELRYIAAGENGGVAARYKCRVRQPWYRVPGVRVPDFVLGVFSECPILLNNDAGYFASNSLLCGFARRRGPESVSARWYTSLTLLQCELEVHALGGGVMVMIPGEAAKIRLPRASVVETDHLTSVHEELRQGRVSAAYRRGDEPVLIRGLGLDRNAIALIREGTEALARWRTSARS